MSGEEGEEGEGARGYKAAGPTPGREDFRQEATEHGEEMGPADEEEEREGGDGEGETPRGATGEVIRVGGGLDPPRGKRGST